MYGYPIYKYSGAQSNYSHIITKQQQYNQLAAAEIYKSFRFYIGIIIITFIYPKYGRICAKC